MKGWNNGMLHLTIRNNMNKKKQQYKTRRERELADRDSFSYEKYLNSIGLSTTRTSYTEEDIWNDLEDNRTKMEKYKIKILDYENRLRNPSSDIALETQISYCNQQLAHCNEELNSYKKERNKLRSKLSADLLDEYDQEVLVLHLRS